jgi:uncharacterized protein (DUF697 family)
MSPKKLPKAIRPARADAPEADARDETGERRTRRRRGVSKASALDEPAAPQPASPPAVAEEKSPPEARPEPVEGELLPPTSAKTATHAARRRAVAGKLVERYKLYAAFGALSPLALMTSASVTVVILRMVKLLSDLYQVPFERDRTRSIIVGLMGGAVPTGLGVATASTLALAVPSVAFVGIAVSAVAAAAATERIGFIFIERLEGEAASSAAARTGD